MQGVSNSMTLFLSSLLPLLVILSMFDLSTYGQRSYQLHQLEITDIKMYDDDSTTLEDYHPNQDPLLEVHAESRFVVNALVKNQNHTAEHFDYITEIIDNKGMTVYLHVRYGVAVNLGGQIPIDSATTPITLNETGTYFIKVFAWRNTDDHPIPLSEPAEKILEIRS